MPSSINSPELAASSDFILAQDHSAGTIIIKHSGNIIFETEVYDVTGKKMLRETSSGSFVFRIDALPTGIYILKVIAGNSVKTFKVSLPF